MVVSIHLSENMLRDKDEQGDERSHLNATQGTTSKGASPPKTREMKAMRVVLSDWLLLAVVRAQGLRISETEGGLRHGGRKNSDMQHCHSYQVLLLSPHFALHLGVAM